MKCSINICRDEAEYRTIIIIGTSENLEPLDVDIYLCKKHGFNASITSRLSKLNPHVKGEEQ